MRNFIKGLNKKKIEKQIITNMFALTFWIIIYSIKEVLE